MGISSAIFVIFWISLHECTAAQTCEETIPGSCDFSIDECNYTCSGGWKGGYMANGGKDGYKGSIVSPYIPAGNYSLSFWYFLSTNKSAQLNVSLHTQSLQKQIWSLPSDFNVSEWTQVKLDLVTNTDFKINFTGSIPGFTAVGIDDIIIERRNARAVGSCPFSSQTDTCGYSVQPKWSVEQKFQPFSAIRIESSNNDGYFLLFNSDSLSNGTNHLSTPCIKSGTYCLEISYISFGSKTNVTVLLNSTGRLETLDRIEGTNTHWRRVAYNISTNDDFQVTFNPILRPRVYVGLDDIILRRVNNTGDCNVPISKTTTTKQTVNSKTTVTKATVMKTSSTTPTPTTTTRSTTSVSTTTTPTTTSTTTPTTTSSSTTTATTSATTTPSTTSLSTTTTPTTTSTTTPTTPSTTTSTTTTTTTPTTPSTTFFTTRTTTTTMPTTTSTTTTSSSTATTPTTTSTTTTPKTTSTATTRTTTSTKTLTPAIASTTKRTTTSSTTKTPETTSTTTTTATTTSTLTTKTTPPPTTTTTSRITTSTTTQTTTSTITTTPTTTSFTTTTPETTSTTSTPTNTSTRTTTPKPTPSTTTTTPSTTSTITPKTTPTTSTTTTIPKTTSTTTHTTTTTTPTTTSPSPNTHTTLSITTSKPATTSPKATSATKTTTRSKTTTTPASASKADKTSTPKSSTTKPALTAPSTTETYATNTLTRNTTQEITTGPNSWTSNSVQNISTQGTRHVTVKTNSVNYTDETTSSVMSETRTKFVTSKPVSTSTQKITTSQYKHTDKTSRLFIHTTPGYKGRESHQKDKKSDTPAIIGGVTGGLGALVLILVSLYCYMRYHGRKSNVRSANVDDEIPPTFDKSGKRNSNDLSMQKINGNGVNTAQSPGYSAMYMQPIDDPTNRFSERSFDDNI